MKTLIPLTLSLAMAFLIYQQGQKVKHLEAEKLTIQAREVQWQDVSAKALEQTGQAVKELRFVSAQRDEMLAAYERMVLENRKLTTSAR